MKKGSDVQFHNCRNIGIINLVRNVILFYIRRVIHPLVYLLRKDRTEMLLERHTSSNYNNKRG